MGVYPENYHLRDTPACRGKTRRLYRPLILWFYMPEINQNTIQ
jgi:hypothetical protein